MAVPAQSSGAIPISTTTQRRFQISWIKLVPFLFILPAFTLFVLMRYVPAVQAIYYSFTEWNGIRAAEFVGLDNYVRLFQDQLFLDALTNMMGYTVMRTLIVVVMAFFAAELVYSIRNPFMQTFWKIAFIIPLVVPGSVVLLVWAFVFNTQSGILNSLLAAVGLEHLQQPWLGQSSTALWSILFIGFPFISSFAFLIYTSSLQSLPSEVLDAARVDGCNTLRRIFYIDIPLMRGPVALTVILLVLEGIQVLTPQIVLTGGGPGTSTESPANFLYRTAFQYGKFGYATAVGVVMLLIGFVFSYFSIRMRYRGAADVDI
jgi:ABC-type sugar transport system permease subunit